MRYYAKIHYEFLHNKRKESSELSNSIQLTFFYFGLTQLFFVFLSLSIVFFPFYQLLLWKYLILIPNSFFLSFPTEPSVSQTKASFIHGYYNLREIMRSITPYEPLCGLSPLPVILLKIWEKI